MTVEPRSGSLLSHLRRALVIFMILNVANAVPSFLLQRFGYWWLNVYTTLTLAEAAVLLIVSGFADLMESAIVRKSLRLLSRPGSHGRDWDRKRHGGAQSKTACYLLAGVFLFAETVLLLI